MGSGNDCWGSFLYGIMEKALEKFTPTRYEVLAKDHNSYYISLWAGYFILERALDRDLNYIIDTYTIKDGFVDNSYVDKHKLKLFNTAEEAARYLVSELGIELA